jgi:hypothetical protein
MSSSHDKGILSNLNSISTLVLAFESTYTFAHVLTFAISKSF